MRIGQVETTGSVGRRDAHHVAGILVRSCESIQPGDSVRFVDTDCTSVLRSHANERHGIADPFVRDIPRGSLFWVLLEPESVSNLTHHFDVKTDLPGIPVPISPAPTVLDDSEDSPKSGYDPPMSEWESADNARCRGEGCQGY